MSKGSEKSGAEPLNFPTLRLFGYCSRYCLFFSGAHECYASLRISALRLSFISLIAILLSFLSLWILQFIFLIIGSAISDFSGSFDFQALHWVPGSEDWNPLRVQMLYGLPWLGQLLLWMLLRAVKAPLFWSRAGHKKFLRLCWSWSYLLLTLSVFFMPLWEVWTRGGLYHSLSYFFIPRLWQGVLTLALWIPGILTLFSPASMFASLMPEPFAPDNGYVTQRNMIRLFMITLMRPFAWFTIILLLMLNAYPLEQWGYMAIFWGLLLQSVILNGWGMRGYRVVVRGRKD